MKNLILFGTLSLAVYFIESPAFGLTYTDEFPSEDSTVIASIGIVTPGQFGYFWTVSRGDSITKTFLSTGLDSATRLELDFEITQNLLDVGATLDWGVFINNTEVGQWALSNLDGVGSVNVAYNFPPITAPNDYTISMRVQNDVPDGSGAIAIGYPGTMTLTGSHTAHAPDSTNTITLVASSLCCLAIIGFRQVKAGTFMQ